jgi:putative SOS response-associated peptidase YedK
MCGRSILKTLPQSIIEAIADITPPLPDWSAQYNIAPTNDIPIIRLNKDGQRVVSLVRWGLIPSWAKDPSIGNRMINARGETLAEKPAFRVALARRRCLIPSDGFYEWKAEGKAKQPFFIHPTDGRPFCFGGLWERWTDPAAEAIIDSATIITVSPNSAVKEIHDRMPLIIAPADYGRWLSEETPADEVQSLLQPYAGDLESWPVSTRVNSPANKGPQCAEELRDGAK